MNARTFGRKGAAEQDISAPLAPVFGNRAQDSAPAPTGSARRRDAFLAAERARAEDMAPTKAMPAASEEAIRAVLAIDTPPPPTDRSIRLAYALWFVTGLFGGHRFYLRRPFTGAAQAAMFFGCIAAVLLEYHWAFAGLGLSWLCFLIDGIRLKHLHLWSGRA